MLPRSAPWSTCSPVTWLLEGRFQGPTTELPNQNLWVVGDLEICPETSFGEQTAHVGEAPRAGSS